MMILDFYGLPERVSDLLTQEISAASLDQTPQIVELAWYLRQRDTHKAMALADQAESLLSTAHAEHRWPEITGRLSLIRGEIARLFGRTDEAHYYMSTAEDLFRQAHDPLGQGDALVLQAGIAGDQGLLKDQQALLAQARQHYLCANDPIRLAFTQAAEQLAGTFGVPTQCPTPSKQASFDPSFSSEHPALVGAHLARQAYTAFASGRATAAALLASRAYPLCYTGGRWRLAVAMASLAAVGYASDYDGKRAAEWLERSLELAHRTHWPWTLAVSAVRAAWVLHRLTLPDAASDLLEDCQPALALLHQSRITALARCAEGEGLLAAGAGQAAEAKFTQAEQWARGRNDTHVLHAALLGQARAQAKQDRPAAALILAEHALQLAKSLDAPAALAESLDLLLTDASLLRHSTPAQQQTWLDHAQELASTSEDLTLPPALLSALAQYCASNRDFQAAYHWEHQATQVRDRLRAGRTEGHAATLHSRRRALQAQREIDSLRHSISMESTRADALSGMVHTLERLSFVGQDIMANLDRQGILAALNRRGAEMIGGQTQFSLAIIDPETDIFQHSCTPPETPVRLSSQHPWSEVAAQRFERVLEGPTGPMLAPLLSGDRCLGILEVSTALPFDEHRRAIIRALAVFTANALSNAAQTEALADANARLERIANYDGLTNIPNRRFFYQTAERAVKSAQRHHRPLAVILLDIDFFKKVNDSYGHAAGDSVLKEVARTLAEHLRPEDMVGRLGGEEFALLLPDCTATNAAHTAERLRAAIAALKIDVAPHRLSITISLGVSDKEPQDASIESILQRADEALYCAKGQGRNQVHVAKVLTP